MFHKRIPTHRLIVVSNRLPVVLRETQADRWRIEPAIGGLVTALTSVLRRQGGMWIGWPGVVDGPAGLERFLNATPEGIEYSLRPVPLTAHERNQFYLGFCNQIIWPLFHDLLSHCNFAPGYWTAYQAVNRTFAHVIAQEVRRDDYIWVHDYHLMNVASELHELGVRSPIAFFLHTPFPPPDIFLNLPWRMEVLRALLDYDLIGFQTARDQWNFVHCIHALLGGVTLHGSGPILTTRITERTVRLGQFPIGIDFQLFARQAMTSAVADMAQQIQEAQHNRQLLLGIDRLDYTKGILQRLEGFRAALRQFPELRRKVTLTQVVVPSRVDISAYHDLKGAIEQLVSEINGEFTQADWVPVQYIARMLDQAELLPYYRTAAIALITPLKDGMNLVAKEYCACSRDDGVLILSEFAGAAGQLRAGALLVNPYDIAGVAAAIQRAVTMSPEERQTRMRRLRHDVREHDVFGWVDSFLRAWTCSVLGDENLTTKETAYEYSAAPPV